MKAAGDCASCGERVSDPLPCKIRNKQQGVRRLRSSSTTFCFAAAMRSCLSFSSLSRFCFFFRPLYNACSSSLRFPDRSVGPAQATIRIHQQTPHDATQRNAGHVEKHSVQGRGSTVGSLPLLGLLDLLQRQLWIGFDLFDLLDLKGSRESETRPGQRLRTLLRSWEGHSHLVAL